MISIIKCSKVIGILGGLFLSLYIGLPVSIAGQCNSKSQEQAIRQFIENQISEQHLNETYLFVSGQLANMFQEGFQTELQRQLSENEKQHLHYFWFRKIKEIMPPSALEAFLIPVVTRYLTYDDIMEINHFYSTQLGKKLRYLLPVMERESKAFGQIIGRKLGNSEWMNSTIKEMNILFKP